MGGARPWLCLWVLERLLGRLLTQPGLRVPKQRLQSLASVRPRPRHPLRHSAAMGCHALLCAPLMLHASIQQNHHFLPPNCSMGVLWV